MSKARKLDKDSKVSDFVSEGYNHETGTPKRFFSMIKGRAERTEAEIERDRVAAEARLKSMGASLRKSIEEYDEQSRRTLEWIKDEPTMYERFGMITSHHLVRVALLPTTTAGGLVLGKPRVKVPSKTDIQGKFQGDAEIKYPFAPVGRVVSAQVPMQEREDDSPVGPRQIQNGDYVVLAGSAVSVATDANQSAQGLIQQFRSPVSTAHRTGEIRPEDPHFGLIVVPTNLVLAKIDEETFDILMAEAAAEDPNTRLLTPRKDVTKKPVLIGNPGSN